jgi:hypothetical protein
LLSSIAISDTGMMNSTLMLEWMIDFEEKTCLEDDTKWRQLTYDFHKSHLAEDVLDYARDHQIAVTTYPTNATHIFQGLDVCVFSPFKRAIDEAKWAYEELHGGGFNAVSLLKHLHKPWEEAFTSPNLISAFAETGLPPIDPSVVTPDMMAGREGNAVAQREQWNPALKAIMPLVRQADNDLLLPSNEALSSQHMEEVPIDAVLTSTRAHLSQAAQDLRQTEMAWLLDPPLNTSSTSHVYTDPLGCLPPTPEKVRAHKQTAQRRALQGNFESAYNEMKLASDATQQMLKEACLEVEAHNANHVINQPIITQQRVRLANQEEKKNQGPVQNLAGTRHQFWANQGEMMEAVRTQNRMARKKEEQAARRKKRAERKKRRAALLKSFRDCRTAWQDQERIDRQKQIDADCHGPNRP